MNEIKLTVSLKEEDRERIDALTAALSKLTILQHHIAAEPQNAPQADEAKPNNHTDQTTDKPQENAEQAPQPQPDIGDGSEVPAPQLEAAAPVHSREDVQRKVVALCASGKKPEVKEIVNAYAERVGAIPEDKLDECMGKLIALEG